MRKYRKPTELKGWDFSQVRVVEEGPRLDYARVVESHLGRNKTLLDVGTGGVERLKAFAPKVREAIGIDIDRRMIKTAAENLSRSPSHNVNLILCDSEKMPIIRRKARYIEKEIPKKTARIRHTHRQRVNSQHHRILRIHG